MNRQFFVMLVNSAVNVVLSLAKIFVGFVYNSQLLLADGIHSMSDLLTDIFAMIGLYAAKKPKDAAHPFGHGNLEYASSLTVSIIIFFMAYELVKELMGDWGEVSSSVNIMVLGVSIITFVAKLLVSSYVYYNALKLDSLTLKNSSIESRADAYSTLVVIAGLLLTQAGITYSLPWLVYAEKIATIVVIVMLVKAAWTIYYSSVVGIAGTHASEEITQEFLVKAQNVHSHLHIKNVLVLKQGIHYAVHVDVLLNRELALATAVNSIKELREALSIDERVQRVSIEIDMLP